MPRIRKKTSKRGTTNQREKIKHKVSETRKKRKKEVKKNTQWKSKHKKDPGIPNNFPYKDQILAEVAEQRRQAEEAKQLRKELKKTAKASTEAGGEEGSEHEESEAEFDGVAAINGASLASGSRTKKTAAVEEVEEEEEAPVLINPELANMKAILDAADVVVEMLDARDPLTYRSSHIEQVVKEKDGRKLVFVLNKIGQRQGAGDDALGTQAVLSIFEKWATEKTDDEPLVVAIVGVANSGKSSFVNSLLRKAAVPVYQLSSSQDGPSTTSHAQEVVLEVSGKKIRLIDTPAVSWIHEPVLSETEKASVRARDILTRNRGRIDRLKDPEPAVLEIATRAHRDDLMLFYSLPAFAEGDVTALLSALARAQGLIKKAGVPDVVGAARVLLRDWSTGKFPRYTVPPATTAGSENGEFAEEYANDEQVLATLTPRKELRKSSGLIKLKTGAVEDRKMDLEMSWVESEQLSDEDDEEAEEPGAAEDESEDEDEEDEDEPVPVQPTSKRKRGLAATSGFPPAKKVAFAPEPKNTKQARSAAGARGATIATSRKAKAADNEKRKASSKPNATVPGKSTKSKHRDSAISAKTPAAKKVANAASSKSKKAAVDSAAGEEAYDFKKFF
ncbi:hypothetical protein NM688_g8679 [Phlebia brevispora]|uniref:Uncharacterized protein n=1 Tax=Phlebia brevispora TaxID=194682 RepID=A0ACC1RTC9_9APHY|nr:hypothetical protein NM688_g8679 [Phlebia brevispora]